MNLLQFIRQQFRAALEGMVDDPSPYLGMIKPAQDQRHGDYQANCAMSLTKVLGGKPRDLAQQITGRLALGDAVERVDIAGPGFINLRMRDSWLAEQIGRLARDDHLGVERSSPPRTFVIDFSSPNVAKPMHVGHLRSTIIGDSLARLLRYLGHRVIADNHLGDWGTQFGMLLYGYKHFRDEAALRTDPVREMARLYLHVRGLMKEQDDEAEPTSPVEEAARRETALLHAGDPTNRQIWEQFMPACRAEVDRIYERLGVHFDFWHGESFYEPMLADVIRSLMGKGMTRESEGALVVDGPEEPPVIVRKRDGAFNYTTSDLATIRYRVKEWNPDVMLYVVDARQALHFRNLFAIARRWGYEQVAPEHISFGSVLGPDRRPIKTREGGAVELSALLDEAVVRAGQAYERSRAERLAQGEEVPELSEADRARLVETVGLGAVKYADLSQNRTSDYVFSWDKMLAMDGNTATYMQYAYARIRNIFRKGDQDPQEIRMSPPAALLQTPAERALAVEILRFPEALESAAADYKPNALTGYLWDLAKSYSTFYQTCPVLRADSPSLRQSRLLLCDLTARTIQQGLDLLGIQTVERM